MTLVALFGFGVIKKKVVNMNKVNDGELVAKIYEWSLKLEAEANKCFEGDVMEIFTTPWMLAAEAISRIDYARYVMYENRNDARRALQQAQSFINRAKDLMSHD